MSAHAAPGTGPAHPEDDHRHGQQRRRPRTGGSCRASSGLGPVSAVTITGSSAIPQMGHAPGPGCRISGCIGQVYSATSVVVGPGDAGAVRMRCGVAAHAPNIPPGVSCQGRRTPPAPSCTARSHVGRTRQPRRDGSGCDGCPGPPLRRRSAPGASVGVVGRRLHTSSYRPARSVSVVQPAEPAVMPSPEPGPHDRDASPRLPASLTARGGPRRVVQRPRLWASGRTTRSWVRHPRFDTTRVTVPAATCVVRGTKPHPGADRGNSAHHRRHPQVAEPDLHHVPGSVAGGMQVRVEEWYPLSRPIIAEPSSPLL